ncbi:MAG: T9SS type A sorting domain-containing protein [candidate division WOR-3 bacterium]
MKRQKINLIFCALAIPVFLFSQITFEHTYGGPYDEEGYSVQQTIDGGYIFTGFGSLPTEWRFVLLFKVDAYGNTLWGKMYYTSYWYNYGYCVRQTSDQGYIVVGATQFTQGGQFDVYLIKTDADGNMLWSRTYDGPDPGHNDAGEFIQQTSDGGYIIAGSTERNDGYYDIYLIKTDSLGSIIWAKTYGNYGVSETGREVQITSDGGYIIVGDSMGLYNHQVYLVKTDSLGNLRWTRSYGGSGYDWGRSVKETSDGGYIIAGTLNMNDAWLIKTDSLGNILWTRTYGGSDMDCARSVQLTNNGGFILAGWTFSFGAGSCDFYIVKTDSAGDTLCTRTYGGGSADWSQCLEKTLDSGYVIIGMTESFGAGGRDVYLVKTDSLGNVIGVEELEVSNLQSKIENLEVYPNPFSNRINIRLRAHDSRYRMANFSLKIYDIPGRVVKDLTNNLVSCILHHSSTIFWDGTDDFGRKLPSGVYFVRMQAEDYKETKKVMLLK